MIDAAQAVLFVAPEIEAHSPVRTGVVEQAEAAAGVAESDKVEKLRNFLEGAFPGRWETLRPINRQEIKATTVLSMAIDEGSAKVRTGQPVDDDDDYALPIWAGVVPTEINLMDPIADPRNLDGVAVPDNVANFAFDKK